MAKVLTLVFLLLLLGPVVTSARAETQQEQSTLIDEANSLTNEFNNLKAEREKLSTRFGVLKDAQGMILSQMAKFKTDKAALDIEISSQQSHIDAHNGRCSGGSSSNVALVNSCNAEVAQLQAIDARLNQSKTAMNARLKLIDTAIDTETTETQKVVAADKAAAERQRQIVEKLKPILARLEAIQAQVDDCKKAIADVDAVPDSNVDQKILYKEKMHSVCGALFDGNNP